ncbi:hypothetical protein GCM10010377_12730 [Streptomyces viridiviolaceus]|uniref:Integral membrane protein n=1 Tax=Streptomyces viridiviolaceus TaxID=68282 RepID=A0ABW2E4R1_9ACTN|nr:hypothetical protein [Streptomyces viridiviolaceus]GHB24209.1 hypothetical protein GCM10010377_12730 [Streptomyces viridiviolaceus]
MAHTAPAIGGTTRPGPSTPDVFGPGVHAVARWAVPVVLGLVYGYWAAANRRDAGPITGWNLLFGFLTALVFAVLYVAVRAIAQRLRRELHAVAWAAFAGIAFGFLYSQTGASVLKSTGLSLVIGAALFAVLFYRYYTHEDAEGRRVS